MSAPSTSILIAEDEKVSRHLLQAILKKWGYEVRVTEDGDQAWEALSAPDAPGMAILDWMMPGMTGPELVRRLRESELESKDAYVILLTSRDEKNDIVAGLEAGADDYVTKPFNRQELHARVGVGARILRLKSALADRVEELEVANGKLREMSFVDGLTGIPNRRRFDEMLDAEWRRCRRKNERLALLMMDVDWFKKYNDGLGHLSGDDCLKRVAAELARGVSRSGDLAARYGGEEFAVLLPETDREGCSSVAEKLRASVQELGLKHPDSPHGGVVTVSVGMACVKADQLETAEALITMADQALYRAKAQGRNCVAETPDPPTDAADGA